MKWSFWPTGWLAILAGLLLHGLAWAQAEPDSPGLWLLVDTREQTLSVLRGDEVIQTYRDIAIGRFGTTEAKRTLDGKTPLGEFRITRIAERSDFHRFFGIDYPNLAHARAGLEAGLISPAEFAAIRAALRRHTTPPQLTALGGYIGIHGLGDGDPAIHEDFNWTNGCVALTNEQMDDLAQWVREGMRVVIQQ
jgi:murein L,D-transpeptidase YafK